MLWEYPFCLLGCNDGGERNLCATLYDESQHDNPSEIPFKLPTLFHR